MPAAFSSIRIRSSSACYDNHPGLTFLPNDRRLLLVLPEFWRCRTGIVTLGRRPQRIVHRTRHSFPPRPTAPSSSATDSNIDRPGSQRPNRWPSRFQPRHPPDGRVRLRVSTDNPRQPEHPVRSCHIRSIQRIGEHVGVLPDISSGCSFPPAATVDRTVYTVFQNSPMHPSTATTIAPFNQFGGVWPRQLHLCPA